MGSVNFVFSVPGPIPVLLFFKANIVQLSYLLADNKHNSKIPNIILLKILLYNSSYIFLLTV